MEIVNYDGHYKGTLLDYSTLGVVIGSGSEDGSEKINIEISKKNGTNKLEKISVEAEVCCNKNLTRLIKNLHDYRGLEVEFDIINGKYNFNF
ncbi:MAG TPA: hypothetical protein VJJ23_04640 [Candidatus Nanoarchaeia archaeon]|nr:hypothetical protein [Candidatus Nanoarchaeia archaeon]